MMAPRESHAALWPKRRMRSQRSVTAAFQRVEWNEMISVSVHARVFSERPVLFLAGERQVCIQSRCDIMASPDEDAVS